MTRSLILTFEVPRPVAALAARFGLRLLTRRLLAGADHARYRALGGAAWVQAHGTLKTALDAVYISALTQPPLAASRVSGLPVDRVADRLTLAVGALCGFDALFATTCRAAFPEALVVLAAPAPVRAHLTAAGLPCDNALSALAWGLRRMWLTARGLASHGVHFRRAWGDETRPGLLPSWARDERVACWPLTDAGAFAEDPARLNIGDFVRTGAVEPFRDCPVMLVSQAKGRIERPVVKVRDIFAARRGPTRPVAALRRALAEQVRLAMSLLFGGWREVVMAGETATLPRARLFVDSVAPGWIVGALPNLAGINLWIELARLRGARSYMVCNSAQTTSIHQRDEAPSGFVPFIYMHPSFDRYGAWTPAHAQALARFGINPDQVEIAGPLVFSARPARKSAPAAGRVLLVDYFDQVPHTEHPIGAMGAPGFYWSVDRLTRTVQDLLAALERALPRGSYRLRIKSKKLVGGLDQGYLGFLAGLPETHPFVDAIEPRTSALTLNADSDLTIGFPFASPVISARWYGVPACFYDVDGEAARDPLIIDTVPVLTGVDALADWIAREYRTLLEPSEDQRP